MSKNITFAYAVRILNFAAIAGIAGIAIKRLINNESNDVKTAMVTLYCL